MAPHWARRDRSTDRSSPRRSPWRMNELDQVITISSAAQVRRLANANDHPSVLSRTAVGTDRSIVKPCRSVFVGVRTGKEIEAHRNGARRGPEPA